MVATSTVRVGLQLPQAGPNATPAFVERFLRHATGLGLRSFWVGDHIVLGGFHHRAKEGETFLDALSLLAFVAGLDREVELGTSVLIAPYRNAFALAKNLCTTAALTGRRFIVGVGAGWAEVEFDTVGVEFRRRGRTTDTFCEMFTRLQREPDTPWRVGSYRYPGGGFLPLPTPAMELWVGGNSNAARRRAARYASGWQPTGLTPDEVRAGLAELRTLCEQAGRDPSTVAGGIRLRLRVHEDSYRTELPATLAAYVEAGVRDFLCEVNSRDQDYTLAAVERLVESFRLAGVTAPR
jgi:alkanesulfonate monooxygenase SsuD/methylene tetrahydromethanopterin reductase-like flavin-dependent oxidoreductase (luciferase family)